MRSALFALLLASSAAVLAQSADVALVGFVSGNVSFAPAAGPTHLASAFMKVREGDRFSLPPDAELRLVYYDGARQERWLGPASFEANRAGGESITGKPAAVTALPIGVQQHIARVPELIHYARLGGTQLGGGIMRSRGINLEQPAIVAAARATYAQMQHDMPGDDITPELYLCAVLYDFQLYEDMKSIVGEMRRKQPDSDDIKLLETWVAKQALR